MKGNREAEGNIMLIILGYAGLNFGINLSFSFSTS